MIEEYMKLPYTIELVQEEDGTYFVKVKELPGCMSVGKDPNEAVGNVRDAMRGWFEAAIEDRMEIPTPTVLNEKHAKVANFATIARNKKKMVDIEQLETKLTNMKSDFDDFKHFVVNIEYDFEKMLEEMGTLLDGIIKQERR